MLVAGLLLLSRGLVHPWWHRSTGVAVQAAGSTDLAQHCAQLFEQMDADHSGTVDVDELRNGFASIGWCVRCCALTEGRRSPSLQTGFVLPPLCCVHAFGR